MNAPSTISAPIPSTNDAATTKVRLKKPKGHGDLQLIPLALLRAHPSNPRISLNEQVISGISAQLCASGQFHPAHAIVARPLDGAFQVVEGHHRVEAARRAELIEIPTWVRILDDEEALLALGLGNTQGELSGLEVGLHSLSVVNPAQGKKGIGISAYAKRVGIDRTTLVRYRQGAEVYQFVSPHLVHDAQGCRTKALHLGEISKTEQSLWLDLVRECLAASWTVRDAADRVRAILKPAPPDDPEPRSEVVTMAAVKEASSPPVAPVEGERQTPPTPSGLDEMVVPTVQVEAPAEAAPLPPSTPADPCGSSAGSMEDALQEGPGVEVEQVVWQTAGYGSEIAAVEEQDGSYVLQIELPSTRVVLRLIPSDTGVLLRVEPAPVEVIVRSEVVEAVLTCPQITIDVVAPVTVPEASEAAGEVVVPEATEVVTDGTAVTEEPETIGGDDRVTELRRRLRVLVRENRTTVAKCASKLQISPKTLMSGDITAEQVEALAAEVARVVKRGWPR